MPVVGFLALIIFATPATVFAEVVECVNSYSGYQVRRYELPPNTLNPGFNQHNSLRTDIEGAKRDMGKTFFTLELTSFNDSECADGPCRNTIPGIAHRTWPLNSCVAVCNVTNKACTTAIVMDRGPNTQLRCRTIDANPALQAKLNMQGGTVPATYSLIAFPGEPCSLGAARPTNVDLNSLNVSSRNISGYGGYGGGAPLGTSPLSLSQPIQQVMQVSSGQGVVSGGTTGTTGGGTIPNPRIQNDVPGVNSSPTPGPGVATLIVQSQSIRRGNPIFVAWSTLGMKTDAVCELSLKLPTQAAGEVARGNGGSRPVTIPISAQTGTGEMILNCTPITGSAIEKRVSFIIE